MNAFSRVAARTSLTAIPAICCLLTLPSLLLAADSKPFVAHATGSIVSRFPCSETEICQESRISGTATRLGPFTGILDEQVNILTGTYTGTGVFTFAGGTITTTSVGQAINQEDGSVVFTESHVVVSGTGRFAGATGTLQAVGTASVAGELTADIVGTLSR